MRNTIHHALAALTVIAAAASFAFALDNDFNLTRPGPDQPAPFSCTYKYKVKGASAKGAQKYAISVGSCYAGGGGVFCSGNFEATSHDRPVFFTRVDAYFGDGKETDTSGKAKFDSDRADAFDSQVLRETFADTMAAMDADIAGSVGLGKKPPVAVGGTFDVDRLSVGGKVRISGSGFSGGMKLRATGVVTSGPNQGATFKALIKTRLKKAQPFE